MEGLLIDETTASQLSALAAVPEHPIDLAESGKLYLDPETFWAYLEEIGEKENPEARKLLRAAKIWRPIKEGVQVAVKTLKAGEKIAAAAWQQTGEDAEQQRTEEMGLEPRSQLVRDVAYLFWDAIEADSTFQQQLVNFCFSAITIENYIFEARFKYFKELTISAFRLPGIPEAFRDNVAAILGAFPLTTYTDKMEQLTQIMSREFSKETLQEWRMDAATSAEKHILTIMQAAVGTAESAAQAADVLAEIFRSFLPEAYHQAIRKIAYRFWQKAGKPIGDELRHWFQAEEAMQRRIASPSMDRQSLEKAIFS